MKKTILSFLILVSAYTTLAQVEFENIDLSKAIAKARKSEKNILIHIMLIIILLRNNLYINLNSTA
jgi:hypothetical protein